MEENKRIFNFAKEVTYIEHQEVTMEAGGVFNNGPHKLEEEEEEPPTSPKEEKTPLAKTEIKACIDSVMIDITQQNHWFAIVKPLVWVGVLTDGDYDGAVKFVHSLYPKGLKVNFTKDDIRKMDVDSLRKALSLWNENDSPIHGARFARMKKLATSFFALLSQYDTTQKLS